MEEKERPKSKPGAYRVAAVTGEYGLARCLEDYDRDGIILLQVVFCGMVAVSHSGGLIAAKETEMHPRFTVVGRKR